MEASRENRDREKNMGGVEECGKPKKASKQIDKTTDESSRDNILKPD